jgi:hypothetical protein
LIDSPSSGQSLNVATWAAKFLETDVMMPA